MNVIANQKAALQRGIERSANRFFWIAALTVLNTVLTLYTTTVYGSATALGVAEVANAVAVEIHQKLIGVVVTLFLGAVFAAFGWFARSGNVTVFYVGMFLYALDGILLLVFKAWVGIAVHAYILYLLFNGVQHALSLKRLISQEEAELRLQRQNTYYDR